MTFDQCAATGSGTYVPPANDSIEWDDVWWEWEIVHESNWTEELMASDRNYRTRTGTNASLVLVFDPMSGELFAPIQGIGCIVC